MLVSTLFDRINSALRGIDDEVPTEGGVEATYWLGIINRKKDEWAFDPFENWSSLFEERVLTDPIVSGTQEYDLDADFLKPSDEIEVLVGDQVHKFSVIEPQLRDSVSGAVYIVGKKLHFVDDIDHLDGGTITVPGFYLPADLDAFTDVVPVDDPNWLALAVAAEIAFADVTYEDKMSDLTGMANNLYTRMKAANKKGTITTPRALTTKVKRIGSQER